MSSPGSYGSCAFPGRKRCMRSVAPTPLSGGRECGDPGISTLGPSGLPPSAARARGAREPLSLSCSCHVIVRAFVYLFIPVHSPSDATWITIARPGVPNLYFSKIMPKISVAPFAVSPRPRTISAFPMRSVTEISRQRRPDVINLGPPGALWKDLRPGIWILGPRKGGGPRRVKMSIFILSF